MYIDNCIYRSIVAAMPIDFLAVLHERLIAYFNSCVSRD